MASTRLDSSPISTTSNPYTMAYVSQMLGESEAYIIQLCDRLGIQTHHDIRTGRVTLSSDDVELLRRLVQTETASRRKAYGSYAQPAYSEPPLVQSSVSQPFSAEQALLENHIPVTASPIEVPADERMPLQAIGPEEAVELPIIEPTAQSILAQGGQIPVPPPLPTQIPATTLETPIPAELPLPIEQAVLKAPTTAIRSTSMMPSRSPSTSLSAIGSGDVSMIVETVTSAKESILADLSRILDDKLAGLDELVVELIRSKTENDALKDEIKKLEHSVETAHAESAKYKPTAFGFYRKIK
ncbi:MAG: hypothetical protein KC476_03760 [Cyanobacteria bacterium HKST-UBA06]|nr:hypothetical protein [Cyanobacteria bacterium HKST-UBA04]MCA9807049.1 hypothetical protein [Cyanobacteria bacterium HKST-UBA06]